MKLPNKLLGLACLSCVVSSAIALDRDGGNVSDVWEAINGYGVLIATEDTDGDGVINIVEYYLNLNPLVRDANYLEIEHVSSSNMEVAFLAPMGQRFQWLTTDDLASGTWNPIQSIGIFTGSGNYIMYSEDPSGIQKRFFRLDFLGALDSDSDRLDAFEESLIGTSDATADSDIGGGDGMRDDYEWIHALNPLLDDAGLNPDGDTWLGQPMTNLFEYLINSNPNQGHMFELPGPSGTVALETFCPTE